MTNHDWKTIASKNKSTWKSPASKYNPDFKIMDCAIYENKVLQVYYTIKGMSQDFEKFNSVKRELMKILGLQRIIFVTNAHARSVKCEIIGYAEKRPSIQSIQTAFDFCKAMRTITRKICRLLRINKRTSFHAVQTHSIFAIFKPHRECFIPPSSIGIHPKCFKRF